MSTQVITVNSANASIWTDTGISVNSGDSLQMSATGTASRYGSGYMAGPEGIPTMTTNPASPAPGQTAYALVGRIGNGAPFLVGPSRNLTAGDAGILQLAYNDNYAADNQGSFTVTVTVESKNSYRWQGPDCQNTRSHLELPNTTVVPASFTTEMWVKPTPGVIAGYNFSILKTNCFELLTKGWGEVMLSIRWGSGYGDQYIATPVGYNLENNVWTHISLSMDAGQCRIQFTKASELTNPPTPIVLSRVSNTPLDNGETIAKLGCGTQLPFCGQISEFRIWNSARSEAEIDASRASRLAPADYGNVRCYLPLNDNLDNLASAGSAATSNSIVQVPASDLPF